MPKKKNTTRSDGRIAVQVYIGRVDGKRKYKTVYGNTQKEADEKALQLKMKMRKGIDLTAERDTFGAWVDRWLAIKQTEVGESQYRCYQSSSNYLRKQLEKTAICNVKMYDIQKIILSLSERNPHTKRPSSAKVLSDIRMTARQIFNFAIANRAVDYNPAVALIIPDAERKTRRALTEAEIQWIEETPHRARRAAMIMLYSGLRRGELIPLTWSDIDFNAQTITVCKAVKMVGGHPVIKQTAKTESGNRVITIPKKLVDFLTAEYESEQEKQKTRKVQELHPLVCPSKKGGMMSESAFSRMWESYLCDLNFTHGDFRHLEKKPKSKFDPAGVPFVIEPFTAHCLRHTFATMLYHAGIDVLTARDQLGHSDIKTTLQIYTHLDRKHKKRSMEKLNNYLQNEVEKTAAK